MAGAQNPVQFLSSIAPFRGLPRVELERLAQRLRRRSYEKGETVYSEGDSADSVWVLSHGRIQIFKYSSQGRPLAIESIVPGELFGTLCRVGSGGRVYPCTAIAAFESEALQIGDREFHDLYNRYPAVVMGVCSLCSQRLQTVQSLFCSGQEHVDRRLASLLLKLQKSHGAILPYTKRELAEQVGTTVETTIRVMRRFENDGWIQSSRGKIELTKARSIQEFVNHVS